jgi:hypothetical protein
MKSYHGEKMKRDSGMAVKMSVVVLWVVTLCGLVGGLNAQVHRASQPRRSPSGWRKDFTQIHI